MASVHKFVHFTQAANEQYLTTHKQGLTSIVWPQWMKTMPSRYFQQKFKKIQT